MDNVRLVLWLVLAALLWLSYSTWMHDYAPAPAKPAPAPTSTSASREAAPPTLPPATSKAGESAGIGTPAPAAPEAPAKSVAPFHPIHVKTDVLDVVIDSRGGSLVQADLPRYPVHKDQPNVPVRLLAYSPSTRWVIQTGIRGVSGGAEPDHLAEFTSAKTHYVLAPGQKDLVVTLDWTHGSLHARKIYTFHRGRYDVDLKMVFDNDGKTPWRGAAYARMIRLHMPNKRHFSDVASYSFRGPMLYNGDRSSKEKVEDLIKMPVKETVTDGWMAGIEHHFVAAVIPPPNQPTEIDATAHPTGQNSTYVLTSIGPVKEVPPGGMLDYPLTLFVGPKLQDQLKATAKGLVLTVDYGKLTLLAEPLFWALSKVHSVVHNWGWSIVIVTILIRLAFYKLTAMSGRSVAKMRRLQPRMKALQERYKDDKQALSKATMELYKKEKVNPAAGCLPTLIQAPFFFAYYWVLIESVEMRQAPFMLWINDLSSRDPYFILPALMGVAMLLQQRYLTPPTTDPMQARIMQIMPIGFTVFFAFFPAGLVLYYFTNTTLGILQQWHINRMVAAEKT